MTGLAAHLCQSMHRFNYPIYMGRIRMKVTVGRTDEDDVEEQANSAGSLTRTSFGLFDS